MAGDHPDSALWYWDPDSFVEGEDWNDEVNGTTMTNNGLSSATLSDSSPAVKSNGDSDYGLASLHELGSELGEYALEFEVEWDFTGDRYVMGLSERDDGRPLFHVGLNDDSSFSPDDGNISVHLSDGDDWSQMDGNGGSADWNDGNRHVVRINVVDVGSDMELNVDGQDVTDVRRTDADAGDMTDWQDDFAFFARNSDGSIEEYADAKMGKVIFHNKPNPDWFIEL